MKAAMRELFVKLGYYGLRRGMRLPESRLVKRFSEQGYLADLFGRLRIDCIIDVGAYDGWFAQQLRMAGFAGDIISIEPVREQYERLSKRASVDPRWKVYNFALGSEERSRPFHVIKHRDGTYFSSFLEPALDVFLNPKEVNTTDIENIEIRRLDNVIGDALPELSGRRLFLKIDSQGYDVEVVKGAERCIDCIYGLQSEISVTPIYQGTPHYLEALRYYESLGFSLMNLFLAARTARGGVLEYDCVMARIEWLET